MPKNNENVGLDTHIYSNIVHNCQKVETTQMFINRWMDKQRDILYNKAITSNWKVVSADYMLTAWVNLKDICEMKISSHKEHIVFQLGKS